MRTRSVNSSTSGPKWAVQPTVPGRGSGGPHGAGGSTKPASTTYTRSIDYGSSLCAWGLDLSIGGSRPVRLADVWAYLDSALDFAPLADAFAVRDPSLDTSSPITDLLAWVSGVADTDADHDAGWNIDAPVNEHGLYKWCSLPGEEPETVPGLMAATPAAGRPPGQPCHCGRPRRGLGSGQRRRRRPPGPQPLLQPAPPTHHERRDHRGDDLMGRSRLRDPPARAGGRRQTARRHLPVPSRERRAPVLRPAPLRVHDLVMPVGAPRLRGRCRSGRWHRRRPPPCLRRCRPAP